MKPRQGMQFHKSHLERRPFSQRPGPGNSFFYTAGNLGFGEPYPPPFNGQFTVEPASGNTFGIFTSSCGLTGMDAKLPNDRVDQLPPNISTSSYQVTLPITAPAKGMMRLQFITP